MVKESDGVLREVVCVHGSGQRVCGKWVGMTLKNITTHLFFLPTLQLLPFFVCSFWFVLGIVCVLWKFSPAQSLSICLTHSIADTHVV